MDTIYIARRGAKVIHLADKLESWASKIRERAECIENDN